MVSVWKNGLLAGCTALALSCAALSPSRARAQSLPLSEPSPPTAAVLAARAQGAPSAPSADDLLGQSSFYLEADTLIRDDKAHTWTARGSVEARYNGRTLRANEMVYNAETGVSTARGNVQIVRADGTTEYARVMTLDKDFHTGVAVAFSAHLQSNITVSAAEAIRRNQDAVELNKAIFTPCNICAQDQTPKEPTWSIQASRMVQDPARRLIYYHNAVIRVLGIPVMYTPVFWHPDPTAKRSSGFLAPNFIANSTLGFSYTQPYLWVISPSQDLVVAPQFNTKVNPLLQGEYRKRFYSGVIDARFGYTYEQEFTNIGTRYDNLTSRSYVLAQGAFAPTANWTLGFTAERVTDPLMFQRYAINNVYVPRGLYTTDNLRLISQAYAVRQTDRSYFSIATISFQGLLPGDKNGTFPLVAPLIEGHYEPSRPVLGGTLELTGDAVLLDRSRQVLTDQGPGNSDQRATLSADWSRNFILPAGIRMRPFANARADEYYVSNQSPTQLGDHTAARALGTIGIDASWPFFKRQNDMSIVLEPLAQLAISPNTRPYSNIPNEDSQTFLFDETNLFEYNKSPGFDYYESGQRLNVGGRATFRLDSGGSGQILVGESLRAQPDPSLLGTSLNRTASDWVVAASLQPISQFSAYTRALVNQSTGALDRIEVGANANVSRVSGFLRYLRDDIDIAGARVENMQGGLQVQFTQHWGIVTYANWDIASRVWPNQDAGIYYQDECIRITLLYQHNGTYNRALTPTNQVLVRVTLPMLGVAGLQRSGL
ncbi:MAG TPA: LPS-assembly protein LptD [Caulobacteraceae bacterium]|nr:LPS-assembly protein LptD [Caulobacteraceae bacterium]